MNASKKVERFKQNMVKAVNDSELPVIVCMMVMEDVYAELKQMHLAELAAPEKGDKKDGKNIQSDLLGEQPKPDYGARKNQPK